MEFILMRDGKPQEVRLPVKTLEKILEDPAYNANGSRLPVRVGKTYPKGQLKKSVKKTELKKAKTDYIEVNKTQVSQLNKAKTVDGSATAYKELRRASLQSEDNNKGEDEPSAREASKKSGQSRGSVETEEDDGEEAL